MLQDFFNNLCNRVETDLVAVTLGNDDGEIAGLTISDPPTQAEVQAMRDNVRNSPMTCGRSPRSFTGCRDWEVGVDD